MLTYEWQIHIMSYWYSYRPSLVRVMNSPDFYSLEPQDAIFHVTWIKVEYILSRRWIQKCDLPILERQPLTVAMFQIVRNSIVCPKFCSRQHKKSKIRVIGHLRGKFTDDRLIPVHKAICEDSVSMAWRYADHFVRPQGGTWILLFRRYLRSLYELTLSMAGTVKKIPTLDRL